MSFKIILDKNALEKRIDLLENNTIQLQKIVRGLMKIAKDNAEYKIGENVLYYPDGKKFNTKTGKKEYAIETKVFGIEVDDFGMRYKLGKLPIKGLFYYAYTHELEKTKGGKK